MLGLVLLANLLAILSANSYFNAMSMEVIFPNSPLPLGEINIGGWWKRTITVFDLYGVLIGLTQMVSGSVCHLTKDNKHSLIYWSSAVALSSLVAFEVSIAFWRGLILEGEINAYLSALLVLGIATAEVSVGILVIDYFLVPLFLALAYTLTAPFWAMVERAKERKRRRLENRVLRSGSRVLRALATPLAVTDQAIIDPLRSLDSATADLWSRVTTNLKQKGENHGADEKVASEQKGGDNHIKNKCIWFSIVIGKRILEYSVERSTVVFRTRSLCSGSRWQDSPNPMEW